MFDRISRGWRLGMTALDILRQDSKLLIFPLLSGISCMLVTAAFALPIFFSENAQFSLAGKNVDDLIHNGLAYAVLFAFYFVNYLVIVFFNSALIACAFKRFRGEEPTLGYGFSVAMARLPQIVAWSLVSATVGVILRAIEDKSEWIGKIVAGLLGMAWNVVTFFVLPVLVVENVGPVEAVKRSCAVLRKAWGEAVVANFGTGLIIMLMGALALIPGVAGFLLGGAFMVAGIAISVLGLILVSLISSAVDTIILAALYQYAAQDSTPRQFETQALSAAFAAK